MGDTKNLNNSDLYDSSLVVQSKTGVFGQVSVLGIPVALYTVLTTVKTANNGEDAVKESDPETSATAIENI